MRKNTIIEHDKFIELIKYQPAVTGSAARNHLKMELLNSIISAIGEKWNRMKKETKSAFEYICFLAIEKGFAYAGSQHVSARHDIDSSTIRRHLSYLEKEGCIKRLWRSSSKHNGRGQAVIFLTAHPYYKKYWQNMFFLADNTQPNAQAKNAETPCESKENDRKIESTINKPNILKDFNKRTNVLDYTFTSDNVPQRFAKLIATCLIDDAKTIEEYWRLVKIQTYYLQYDNETTLHVAINSFKQMFNKFKKGKVKNPFGYFWGVLNKKLDEIYLQEMKELWSNAI